MVLTDTYLILYVAGKVGSKRFDKVSSDERQHRKHQARNASDDDEEYEDQEEDGSGDEDASDQGGDSEGDDYLAAAAAKVRFATCQHAMFLSLSAGYSQMNGRHLSAV